MVLLPFFFDQIDITDPQLKQLNDNHQHILQENFETN